MIDVQLGKEKGYETVVKEGLCDEVRPHVVFYNASVTIRTVDLPLVVIVDAGLVLFQVLAVKVPMLHVNVIFLLQYIIFCY